MIGCATGSRENGHRPQDVECRSVAYPALLRRYFVRFFVLILAFMVPISGMSASPGSAGEDKPILRIYAWSEFFNLGVLAKFEDDFNCVVAIDTFDSNESMIEDIQENNAGSYDIITPSSYMAAEMMRRQLLHPIDHSLIANLRNIDATFTRATSDPEMRYSIPYTRTVTGVGYNRQALGKAEESWAIFGRRDLANRMTMLDDMRESLGAALKYLGFSLNTTNSGELAKAGELLLDWRRNLAKFEVDEGNIGLGSGEYLAVHGYNGDLALLMEENGDIDFFVPKEGSAISTDDFVIMGDSLNKELAHRFINYLLDVDTAAKNMEGILYYMPIPAAIELLNPELRENRAFAVPERIIANCEIIRDLGADNAKYEEVWEYVKSRE